MVKRKMINEEPGTIEKVRLLEELFQGMRELFPECSMNLSVHDIEVTQLLDDEWEVEANYMKDKKLAYLSAKKVGQNLVGSNITLFGKP